MLIGCGALWYSALAPALGLGDITVHSALNQPFSADIALLDAAGLAEGELSVRLATPEEFNRAGVERVFFLNDLHFTPIVRGNRSVIRVVSNKPVNEPFLNFLVQANQPNGQLLREYTVLIDPPGAAGIVPSTDTAAELAALRSQAASAFPDVIPVEPSSPAVQGKRYTLLPDAAARPTSTPPVAAAPSSAAPAITDTQAEELAASTLHNQQLQKNLDELQARAQAQEKQIASQQKQIIELQTLLAEARTPPVAPAATVVPPSAVAPANEASGGSSLLLTVGLSALVLLLLLGFFVHRRQQRQGVQEPLSVRPTPAVSPVIAQVQPRPQPVPAYREVTHGADVLEGVGVYLAYGRFAEAVALLREALHKEPQRSDLNLQLLDVLGKQGDAEAYTAQELSLLASGFSAQELADIRARHPKLCDAAPAVALVSAAPVVPDPAPVPTAAAPDEFQLNLDDMSVDANWDLVSPFEKPTSAPDSSDLASSANDWPNDPEVTHKQSMEPFAAPDIEWSDAPPSALEGDDFLDEFKDLGDALALEPLPMDVESPTLEKPFAGKLEQAQTCIDDGDLDSASRLLNELLKDGDEPLKQTARSLLASLR
ncbi:FimV/HubP family polar landmark protein [Pseudomonas purpurea]|uniref:FimV/HubP family polar landmark protein n=1 Tax=Pseudomonas purpurea TaxID=3136737 RepID=UPI0032653705